MTLSKTNPLVTGEAFHSQTRKLELSTSSHEHGWPGRPGFQDFDVFISYDRAGVLGFTNRNIGKRAGKFGHMNTSARLPGWIFRNKMASSCFACCIFLVINIPVNFTESAIRIAKRVIGAKVIILCFDMFALFLEPCARTRSQDLRPFLIS